MIVKVIKRNGRKSLVLRWIDPETGQQKEKSAKTTSLREARKLAAKLEAEIEAGRYFDPGKMTWTEFRDLFAVEKYSGIKAGSATCYDAMFNKVEEVLNVFRPFEFNTLMVSKFQNKLRDLNLSEATISKHLRHLKAALRWAESIGVIQKTPKFEFPKLGRHQRLMKGRPITESEFKMMIDVTESVVGEDASDSWKFLLRGVWASGLRLGEALALTWHNSQFCVDFQGKYPMFRIDREGEKGGQDRILALTPEFSKLLREAGLKRRGHVFNPIRLKADEDNSICRTTDWVSKIGSRIGKKAGVIVSESRSSESKTKYASFHDLRRSFGATWASRVLPQVLMKLMRHDSIDTTLRYYVGDEAEQMAAQLWNDFNFEN